MEKFDKEKIMQPKTVVHCKTEEQANELLKWADSQGLKWCDGESYLARNNFNRYDKMCYWLSKGEYASKEYYQEECYTILEYKDVLIKEDNQEFDYPIYCKDVKSELVVEFEDLYKGVVIEGFCFWNKGDKSTSWYPHTDKKYWIDVTDQYKTSIPPLELCGTPFSVEKAHNNGGSTDYYKFEPSWKECADIIEARNMNYNQGNIFKASFCFNIGRHDGTDYKRELNKVIYFANRELERVGKDK